MESADDKNMQTFPVAKELIIIFQKRQITGNATTKDAIPYRFKATSEDTLDNIAPALLYMTLCTMQGQYLAVLLTAHAIKMADRPDLNHRPPRSTSSKIH